MENSPIPSPLALVSTDPQEDPRVVELYQEGQRLERFARSFTIADHEDAKKAADHLSLIKGVTDAIEGKRVEFVKPLRDRAKDIDSYFKAFTAPLGVANEELRRKVMAYQAEQQRIQDEQERINRLREEAAVADMALNQELSEEVSLVEVTQATKTYHADFTTMSKKTTWKWDLVKLADVPLEYLMIDSSKVGRLVRAGTRNIPGVRIYSEDGLAVSAKRVAVQQPPVAQALEAPAEGGDQPF